MRPPRPIYNVLFAICIALVLVLFVTGITLVVSYQGGASTKDVVDQGARRDCVTTLSTARRAVFDNVDIYKAIEIQQTLGALLTIRNGGQPTEAETAAIETNNALLARALVEARRLQPAKTLDNLIENGGMVDGVKYDACPA